jgi:hypothetical protein
MKTLKLVAKDKGIAVGHNTKLRKTVLIIYIYGHSEEWTIPVAPRWTPSTSPPYAKKSHGRK